MEDQGKYLVRRYASDCIAGVQVSIWCVGIQHARVCASECVGGRVSACECVCVDVWMGGCASARARLCAQFLICFSSTPFMLSKHLLACTVNMMGPVV